MYVCVCMCLCRFLCVWAGLIAGDCFHGPFKSRPKVVAHLTDLSNKRREARDYGRGVPSTGGSIRLGLSRRADSDTLTAGLIGRVAVCRFLVGKISCNRVLPTALRWSQDGLLVPAAGRSVLLWIWGPRGTGAQSF